MQSRNTELLRATLAGSLMLTALVAGAAVAGPLEGAQAAHDRGDDATALGILRPLVDQGKADA